MLATLAHPALAQTYPTKPVRLIVPFPPGGSADAVARPLGEKLGLALGQNIVVENRGGGLTVIAAELVAKAPADGYTLFMTPGAHVLSPYLIKNVPYHPVNDYTPIAMLSSIPYVLFSNPKLPFATLKEMIAYAKANPGKLSVGSTDAVGRLSVATLGSMAKIDITIVAYKGAPATVSDVVGGHIQMGIITPPAVLALYKERRLNALAVTGPARLSSMPDVPTIAEAGGLPGYNVQTWFVLSGPKGLPRAVVERLQREVQKIIAEPDMRQRLLAVGMEPASDTSTARAASLMKSDMERLGKLLQAAGFKPE